MTRYTKRQILTFILLLLLTICNAICYALQAPFYPAVAESKGASISEYGFVFGVYQLVIFLVPPIFGSYIGTIGCKYMLVLGSFTTGSACILFGMLTYIDGTTSFLTLSFLIRIVEALGVVASNTASFTIVAQEFADCVGTTMAALETFFGVGLIIGPTVGGALFELGGFVTPFATLGSCFILCTCATAYLLPSSDIASDLRSKASILTILKIPEVSLAMFGVVAAANNVGFIQASLEPHIRFLNLSPVVLGSMFIISGAVYAVLAPIWGKLCDIGISIQLLSITGASFMMISFLFIGPVPFIPIEPSLLLVAISLGINGFGMGGEVIPGFVGPHKNVIDAGLPRNASTLGLISGLWTSCFGLGGFAGPSIAGLLTDAYGFRYATLYIVALHLIVICSNAIYLCCPKSSGKKFKSNFILIDQEEERLNLSEGECYVREGSSNKGYGSVENDKCEL